MMYLVLPVVVLTAGATVIVLTRRRRARSAAVDTTQAPDAAPPAEDKGRRRFVTRLTDRVTAILPGLPRRWRNRTTSRQPQEMRLQFQAWIAKACADDASLCTWWQQLPEQEGQAFIDQVTVFCKERGFELPWVVEHRLEPYPELAQAAEQVVLHYCRACHQAAVALQDLDIYKTLLAFEHNPADSKTHEFGHKLFVKVVEAGLTSVTMSEYILATPTAQHQYMLQAIREAAERHGEAFIRLLHDIARELVATPVAPPPAAPAAPAVSTLEAQEEATAPAAPSV